MNKLHSHRHAILFAWCCLPIFAAIYHFSDGQRLLARDQALARLAQAQALPPAQHEAADALRKQALQGLDPQAHAQERALIQLRQAQSLWHSGSTSATAAALDEVLRLADREAEKPSAAALWRQIDYEARTHVIRAQHASAWLMRTQGHPRHAWLRELNVARQNASYLLAQAPADPDLQFNLEACLWLERIDLKKLKGLPLPENQQSGHGQSPPSEGEAGEGEPQPGEGEGSGPPQDGRGTSRRPTGSGS